MEVALPLVTDTVHFLFLTVYDLEFQVEDHVMFVMLSKNCLNKILTTNTKFTKNIHIWIEYYILLLKKNNKINIHNLSM